MDRSQYSSSELCTERDLRRRMCSTECTLPNVLSSPSALFHPDEAQSPDPRIRDGFLYVAYLNQLPPCYIRPIPRHFLLARQSFLGCPPHARQGERHRPRPRIDAPTPRTLANRGFPIQATVSWRDANGTTIMIDGTVTLCY